MLYLLICYNFGCSTMLCYCCTVCSVIYLATLAYDMPGCADYKLLLIVLWYIIHCYDLYYPMLCLVALYNTM